MKTHVGSLARKVRVIFFSASVVFYQGAQAGIPVVDGVSNGMRVAEFAQTVAQWGKELYEMQVQYEALLQQYQQMQETHSSMNGSRGVGGLDRSDYEYLSGDWQEDMQKFDYGEVREATKIIDSESLGLSANSDIAQVYRNTQNQNALSYAMSEVGYNRSSARVRSLNNLVDRVNKAEDLKDVQDLQARIQGEQILLQNEQNKIAFLTQLQAGQKEILEQQSREIAIKSARFTKREGW